MPNSISNRQLVFILYLLITAYVIIDLPMQMAQTAGNSCWIPIILASIVFAFAVFMIAKLNNMFQGKVFFDYSQQIVGKFFAYIIAVFYVISFSFIGAYLALKSIGLIKSNFLPKTPSFIILIAGILLFAFVAYKGITNVARLFEIYGFFIILVILAVCAIIFTQGISFNVLPLFDKNEIKNFPDALVWLISAFSGIEILFIIPFSEKNKKAPKVAFLTVLSIGLLYILVVKSTFFILGINNTKSHNDAFVEATRIVDIPLIERADVFFLTFGLVGLFSGIIIVFTAIVEFCCKLFSKIKRIYIVIIVSIVLFVISLCTINIKVMGDLFRQIWTLVALVSSLIIPTIIFIIAKIRKLPK